MSSSNCCFLTCIQVLQEAGQVIWYSHLFQNFPQFIVIYTVKGFDIVNKAEVDVFLELSCFFDDPTDVVLIYFKQILFELEIWLLKPSSPSFPGDWVVKNPPANSRDMDSIPGAGRSFMLQSNQAHAPRLLSLCVEPRSHNHWGLWALEPGLCDPRSQHSEKPPHCYQRAAPAHNWEKSRQQWRPSKAKINK